MAYQGDIQIDASRSDPLYKQIRDQILARIENGTYPAGFRLPPTRELARSLNTNRNTVVRAFEELEAAGAIQSTVGRGTFVAPKALAKSPMPKPPAPAGLPWNSLVSRVSDAEPLSRLDRLARSYQNHDTINLAAMYPSADLLPDAPLRRCIDHVLRTDSATALGYAPRSGLPRLRDLIARELQNRGVMAAADNVLVTTGGQQALDLIARILVNPGDTVLIEDPTYPGALNAFAAVGARVVAIATDAEGPRMDVLRQMTHPGVKAFYLMPNYRNPTGAIISAARRQALIAWSHEAGVPLIEDDYGADLNLDDTPLPPTLRALDSDVLYLSTFSKKLIPALRVGFAVTPQPIHTRLATLKQGVDLGTSALLQATLAEFIDRGYLRHHLRRTLDEYRARRDALQEGLREHLPPEVRWRPATCGVFIWLELPPDIDAELAFDEAQRRGVLVSPATLHTVHRPLENGLRITFCGESPQRLQEGARRLGLALQSILARQSAPRWGAFTPPMDGV